MNDTPNPETLSFLLSQLLEKSDRLLVQKIQMGDTEAYIGSVTLEWLDSRVRFASQLPLFRHKLNPSDTLDSKTLDDLQQRPLDWSRQAPLTLYLATRKSHKFPAVLVVISPSWVDNPNAPEWDETGHAKKSAADFTPFDQNRSVGLLELPKETAIFTLDGQHRLMGVQGLMTLLKTGRLQRYNKLKKPVGTAIALEDIAAQRQVDPSDLQNLAYEQIGIEFIPAILPGETRNEAKRRIRSIFVHVNLTAVNLSKGQLAVLNEDNGFSIIARRVAATHPLLKDQRGRNPRVNWDSATVAAKSTVLTTLQALQEMAERYLGQKFPHWKPSDKRILPLRPDDDELELGLGEFQQLFDILATLPSYYRLEHGAETPELRRFSFEKGGGEGNILFRPVGQIAIAQALGTIVFRYKFPLSEVAEKLRKYDADGGFSLIDNPRSLWYNILYDPNKKRILVSGRDLAAKLLIYILGGLQDNFERAQLRLELAEARSISHNQAMNFTGKFVSLKEVGLPPLLK